MPPSWHLVFNEKITAGNHSTHTFFPPIELDKNKHYSLGLIYFSSFNTVPNVTKSNNLLHLNFDIKEALKSKLIPFNGTPEEKLISPLMTLEIPEGIYDSDQLFGVITLLIRQAFLSWNEKYPEEVDLENLTVKLDPSTCRVVITDAHRICKFDFTRENSIGPLLGFSKHNEPKWKDNHAYMWNHHIAENEPAVHPFNTINIFCNIVKNSFFNGEESHILYSFPYKLNPSQHIHESPQEIIYLPINTTCIREISLSLLDEYNCEIILPDTRVIIALHLKEE